MTHELGPRGTLRTRAVPAPPKRPAILTVADALKHGGRPTYRGLARNFRPWANSEAVQWREENQEIFQRSLQAQAAAEDAARRGAVALVGHLWLSKVNLDGDLIDFGLAGCRVVTTAGVNFIVDAFQNLVELENMKFHGMGTGTTAESTGQTALVTELTTQYSTANTRPTGSLGELSGNANVYETVATITVSATVAATEHAIFSQASNAGGTMLDRTVFTVVNLASGESLLATYDLTFTAGS